MLGRSLCFVVVSTALLSIGAAPAHVDADATVPKPSSSIWIDPGDMPLSAQVQSAEVVRGDEALFVSPGGTRRGVVQRGVRLPIFGATRGPGCISRWLLVGPLAYVCGDKVKLSADPPTAAPDLVSAPPADGLPYRYYFVGRDGAEAYNKPSDVDGGAPSEELERGWSVAGIGEVAVDGTIFVRTKHGRFVPRNELGAVAPIGFHGETIDADGHAIAWVFADKSNVFVEPRASSHVVGMRTRMQRLDVIEQKMVGKESWLHVGESGASIGWMRGPDLRAPSFVGDASPLPDGVGTRDRWIDVDTSSQTLVAYEGRTPIYATMVSTGHAGTPTPKGTFHIWVKLKSTTMSNADDAQPAEPDTPLYSIEDVPWVQFFSNGVALHGAFWHRRFGEAHSHGCVNLAPIDAMWLFDWTTPRLPVGWDAVFPTAAEPATTVRVR